MSEARAAEIRTVDGITFTVKRRCSFPSRPGRLGVRAQFGRVGQYVEADACDYAGVEEAMIELAVANLMAERGSRHWQLCGVPYNAERVALIAERAATLRDQSDQLAMSRG